MATMKKSGGRFTESAHFGQTLITETGVDHSSYNPGGGNEAIMGRKMGGGPNDVGHSLSGAGNVVDYNDKRSAKRGSSESDGGGY